MSETTEQETPTPRVDAVTISPNNPVLTDIQKRVVTADFARTLEIELAVKSAECERLQIALADVVDRMTVEGHDSRNFRDDCWECAMTRRCKIALNPASKNE